MTVDLTSRVIIITGASSGIGAATAIECAKAGMHVVLTARRSDRLEQVAQRVRSHGRRAVIVPGCITDPGMSARLLDTAEAEFGGFYAVFANAGHGAEKAMAEFPMSELRSMFEVNFFCAVELLQLAANRLMAARVPGHLLMCASCLARFSIPLHGHYAASKAAQHSVCWALRAELARHGIAVSSVLPVTTATEFFQASAARSGKVVPAKRTPEHAPRFFTQSPERVARAVVRCLGRPRPEVWTSHIVRLMAGVMTMFPWTAEVIMNRLMQSERKRSMTAHPEQLEPKMPGEQH